MIEIKLECPGQAPRVRRFAATSVTVGRATDCELCLEDPSLSRRHCRIVCGLRGGYVVEDLGSANGTVVAGRRIVGSVAVEPGVAIGLGELRLTIVARGGARGVVAPTAVRAVRKVAPERRGPVGRELAERTGGRGRVARASVAALAVGLATIGGWATAWAWDRPIVVPVAVVASCRADDPGLLAADAAADAAGLEDEVEAGLRGGLRALGLVRGTACVGQSRAAGALRAVLERSESRRLGQHPGRVRGVVAAGEGRVVGLDDEGGVTLWDGERVGAQVEVGDAEAVALWAGTRDEVGAQARWLAVAGSDGGVRVGAVGGRMAEVVRGEPVVALGFMGEGRLIGVERGGRLVLWRAGEDGVWRAAGAGQAWPGVTELRVAGERVLVFGAGRAAVWQPGRRQAPVLLRTGAAITAVAIDGAGAQVVVGDAAGLVTRWSLGRRARSETLTAHAGAVHAVAWAGDAVASVGDDDALRLAELGRRVRRDGPPLVLVAETPVPVDRLVLDGTGRWLLGGGRDGAIVRWDLERRSRRLPATLHAGHAGAVTALAAGEDGWVSGGADGVVRAWDLVDGTGDADASEAGLVRRACRALGWTEPGCS